MNEKQAPVCISAANHLSAALQEHQPQVGQSLASVCPVSGAGCGTRNSPLICEGGGVKTDRAMMIGDIKAAED